MQGAKIDDKGPFPQYFNTDYDVIGVLGRGGMGYVYKGIHKALNREVALKVLDAAVGEEAAKRFYLEAQAMKKLDHQNIVQVYDFGRVGEQLFIAMTFVPGATLADLLQDRGHFDVSETLRIVRQVARGLLYAHNRGVVHRDIKPSNIIVSTSDRIYITDFGISQIQDLERLTSTGMAMGTPEYMSPEQCQGGQVTLQSDIYSLGIVLYEMLSGDPPFTGTKPISVAWKQVYEEPRPLSEKTPGIPLSIENLVMQCLRKDPIARPSDVAQLLEQLDRADREPEPSEDNNAITQEVPRHSPFHAASQPAHTPSPTPARAPNPKAMHRLVPILFGAAGILLLAGIAALLFTLSFPHGNGSYGFLAADSVQAPFEPNSIEGASGPSEGYPTANLSDFDTKTAWVAPAHSGEMPALHVYLSKPSLVCALGIASGYQRSLDDTFQDRFSYTSHPADLTIRVNGEVLRRIHFSDLRGMQYVNLQPFEAQDFIVQIESAVSPAGERAPLAMSELRFLGLTLPKKN